MPEIIGQLKLKYDTQKVSDKFQKRDVILATDLNTPYPQFCQFQLTQDKCDMINSFNIGDEVKAHYNLKGREWNSPQGVKYFNTLEIWKIEKVGNSQSNNSNQNSNYNNNSNNTSAPVFNSSISDNDDLPF